MTFPFSAEPDAPNDSAASGETILLVEDEPAVRNLFAQALRQAGYTVVEARNGAEAIDVFKASERIDLLLTDIRMPYLSGAELAEKLVELKPDLPLLFISGYASTLELGPNAMLLQKPFVRADLLRAVKTMLHRKMGV
jgi:CheY-like chemotaxis protein